MSDLGIDFEDRSPGRRRAKRKNRRFVVLLVLLVLIGLLGFGAYKGIGALSNLFDGPEDFAGEGNGVEVFLVIAEGEWSAQEIGQRLYDDGVVASVEAFVRAANAEPAWSEIRPGQYTLFEEMSANAAVTFIVEQRYFQAEISLVIPEGFRVEQVVDRLEAQTHLERDDIEEALQFTDAIGLPPGAGANPEGYIFPATYEIGLSMTAEDVLLMMVDRAKQELADLDVQNRARELGFTPHEIMTIASIIQAEVRSDDDMPRVARVIYNRLERPMRLEMDSTAHYVSGRYGEVWTSDEERASDSPYNTYNNDGLPPGPIGSPGGAALRAALNPSDEDILFFVTINLETGETVFSETLSEHESNTDLLRQWCRESDTDLC